MKKRDQILLSLLLVLVLPGMFFLGCAREEAVEVELEPMFEGVVEIDRSAWEIGRAGGRLVTSTFTDPKHFNAVIAEDTSVTDYTSAVFDSTVSAISSPLNGPRASAWMRAGRSRTTT